MKSCAADNCSYPVFSNGFCKRHQYLRKDEKYDKRSPIQRYYDNLKKNGCVNKNGGLILSKTKELIDKNNLEQWFLDRRKEMSGECDICGGRTCFDNDKEFKRSIGHLFAKRKNMFPSISTHPENWLELCFYGNSCHTNLDNNILTLESLKDKIVWFRIIRKTKILFPLMTKQEQNKVPEILISELND